MKTIFILTLGFLMLAIGSAGAVEIAVDIDIKPGSCPNPFNGKSKGSVPVAIVGTADFDVNTVDPASISLAGVPALNDGVIDNSTQPIDYVYTEYCDNCFDADDPANFNCDLYPPVDGELDANDSYCGDEYPDLIVKFDTQKLKDAIADLYVDGVRRDDCVELTLTGETLEGDFIEGLDSVLIRTKIK